jgi:hypothetical protein
MEQQPKSELTVLRDYLGAITAVKRARSVFLTIVVLSLLAHIGAYCAARWGRALEARYQELKQEGSVPTVTIPRTFAPGPTTKTDATSRSASAPAVGKTAPPPKPAGTMPGERLYYDKTQRTAASQPVAAGLYGERTIEIVLPIARFTGLAVSGVLIMTYLIGVNICLGGRMGGLCHATSAFFWSIVLVVLLFPWHDLVPGAAIQLPDAFFKLPDLKHGLENLPHTPLVYVQHYGRFIGIPALAILAALVSGVRFGLAYRQVKMAVEPLVMMKVV